MPGESNPQPTRIGPYRIIEMLGRGGMGTVYRAMDTRSSAVVALKTVHIPQAGQVTGIRREIRALARIHHPGVVRIREEGLDSGIPFFVMDFLEGITLRQYGSDFVWGISDFSTQWNTDILDHTVWRRPSASAPIQLTEKRDGPETTAETSSDIDTDPGGATTGYIPRQPSIVPAANGSLDAVLNIILRLCHTLAYLHGEGIVHGDLKPENILIRPDGFPVIFDFGMAHHVWRDMSRELLSSSMMTGGTAAYIAPEVLQGEPIDARADLYSMGCIMFEMLTGSFPFQGEDARQVMLARLEHTPPLPSTLASGIPPELDSLILGLLTPQPEKRIGHADDIGSTLAMLGARVPDSIALPACKPYLYRPRFAGRGALVESLDAALNDTLDSKGHVVFLRGESGIGKTRILMHLASIARRKRMQVISSDCGPSGSTVQPDAGEVIPSLFAFRSMLDTLVQHCRREGEDEARRIFGKHPSILGLFEPGILTLPGIDASPVPPGLSSASIHLQLLSTLSNALIQFAVSRPVLLILDDVQIADELTIAFLEFFIRIGHYRQSRIMILAACRSEEMTLRIERLGKAPGVIDYEIGHLSEIEAGLIIADMLGVQSSSPAFVKYVTEFAEGNPFFIAEYLRAAVSEGLLFRGKMGTWQFSDDSDHVMTMEDFDAIPLPIALVDLVNRRLHELTPMETQIVSSAAVIGNEFPLLLLWSVLPFTDPMLDALDSLIRRQVFLESEPGTIRFVHTKLRKAAYDLIAGAEQKRLHRLCAETIEQIYPNEIDLHLSHLARHWESAGELEKAVGSYHRIARVAVDRHALAEAEKAFDACLRLDRSDSQNTGIILLEFSDMILTVQGRFSEALDHTLHALDIAVQTGDRLLEGHCHKSLTSIYRLLGHLAESEKEAESALAIFRELGARELEGRAIMNLAGSHFNRGKLNEARSACEEAAQIFRELDLPAAEALAIGNMAPILFMQGEQGRAMAAFEDVISRLEAAGSQVSLGRALGNYATLCKQTGDFSRSIQLYERALKLNRAIGDRQSEALALLNISEINDHRKEYPEAERNLLAAIAIQREIQDRPNEGLTLNNLAMLHTRRGSPHTALELYEQALRIHREVGNLRFEAETLLNLANLHRKELGDTDRADGYLTESERLYRIAGDDLGQATCIAERGHLELARDRSAEHYIAQIERVMTSGRFPSSHHLRSRVADLKRAQDAFERGVGLSNGDPPESAPG